MNTTTIIDALNINQPYLVNTIVKDDCIELIYKQMSNYSNNWGEIPALVFKKIYSCKNGKWHVSNKIPGKYIPAKQEEYKFD